MSYKKRDVIIVLGRTGMGKSIWTRIFMRSKTRVFASDLLTDFNADYLSEDELLGLHDDGYFDRGKNFRVATSHADDLETLGCVAFVHGKAWLLIEEAGFYFDAGARAPKWMKNAVFLGRHQELSIIITAQRPTSIPVDMRSQASRIICFNQHETNDVKWLDSYFGERSEEIADLKELECLDATSKEITRYFITPEADDKRRENPGEIKPEKPAFLS